MKRVYYIGYYVDEIYEKCFYSNVPGRLKMKYVNEKINECGYNAKIISLCPKIKPVKARSTNKVRYFTSIPSQNKLLKLINMWLIKVQLILTVLFCIKSNSTVILYHSVAYTHLFRNIRRFKKIDVILEVEEVYGYSATGHKDYLQSEIEDIKSYNKAILVNDYLPKELDFLQKKYVVSYGVCNLTPSMTRKKFDDGKIHAVYAGTIEQKKLGAYSAARSAEFLPNDYQVDIYGFGSVESIEGLNRIIESVNDKCGTIKVRYLGYKSSEELSSVLTMYDIGLSTNIMESDFANNTFPSKVITYMSHGLSIVSGYAEAFDGIELSKKWSFFFNYTPNDIAKAIIDYKPSTIDENKKILETIDNNLKNWLKVTIEENE